MTEIKTYSAAKTDKGRRPNNEDYFTFFEPTIPQEQKESGCIYIVADGVGGASIGERASKYVAEKVLYEYFKHYEVEPKSRVEQAITKANREIFEYADQNSIRMATTITVAVIVENLLIVANVGDSRVYLIRGGEAQQVTNDHNIVGELIRDGVMTEAESLQSKAKNRLTRSIGGNEDVHVDIFDPIILQPGDKILLCSDGLTRYALKEDIVGITSSGSPQKIVTAAIDFAKKRGHGGADNISVIFISIHAKDEIVDWIEKESSIIIKPREPEELAEWGLTTDKKEVYHEKSLAFGGALSLIVGIVTILSLALGIAVGISGGNTLFKISILVSVIFVLVGIYLIRLANEEKEQRPLYVGNNSTRMVSVLRRTGRKRAWLLRGGWGTIFVGILVLFLALFIVPDSPILITPTPTPTATLTITPTSSQTPSPTLRVTASPTITRSPIPTLKSTTLPLSATPTP
jgi:protein phosphatase